MGACPQVASILVRHREKFLPFIKGCTVEGGNFGDDLNLQIWKRLFPNLIKLNGQVHFYGIGTVLGGRHDASSKKVVLGAGLGETGSVAKDNNWDFRWVRGPLTATEFGLPIESGIGDPAILWPELTPGHDAKGPVGLVPHYATWDKFDWATVAAHAGLVAINPHQSPNLVISQMRSCSRLMAESLHGAICADAMGIPWAACVLAHRFNEFKWRDWMATINRPFTAFEMDRPLVNKISATKSLSNGLARLIKYKRHTRHPALRPVCVATLDDAQRISMALQRYAGEDKHFLCSDQKLIGQQRKQMLIRCSMFADQYQLEFSANWL
jgi:succinoglycan biosynthesis protein ExoV